MERKPLGFYNYTVILTYIGMLVGFFGVCLAMDGKIGFAVIALMAAGVCDMFDGAIASTRKRTTDEKCFGIQIDSLSDLICFGVLPAVILVKINAGNQVAFAIAGMYVLAALIRLAFFNVDEQNRQRVSAGSREIYYGLPVTSIAIILPVALKLQVVLQRGNWISIAFVAITEILFLTPFKLKKPKAIGKIAVAICGILEFAVLVSGLGDI